MLCYAFGKHFQSINATAHSSIFPMLLMRLLVLILMLILMLMLVAITMLWLLVRILKQVSLQLNKLVSNRWISIPSESRSL